MLPEKQNSQTNQTEFRDIGGAEGLLTAYQQGERDFAEVNLENADLKKANLVGINLRRANLKGANLEKADFQSADLSEADLSNANLEEAKLDAANLTGAILVQANLSYVYMPCCKLIEANLNESKLVETELTAANLQKSILDKAKCREVRLRKAQLQEASLIQAYLREAKLQFTNLTDANLQKADLYDTELEGAILTRTDLRGAEIARVKDANLEFAILGKLQTEIKQVLHLELKESNPYFSFSFDSELLAYLYTRDDKIIIVNPNNGEQINKIDIQSEPVVSVAFSGDGKSIYESTYSNELKLWNPLTGELIQSLKNHSANFTAIISDSNGEEIGVIGTGEPFEVFDVGHETRTIKGYSTGILTQAHSPDGQLTAKSEPDLDGQIELLERQTGKRICLLTGHKAAVQSLCFSPDSEVLVSKSAKDFKMWRVRIKKETYGYLTSSYHGIYGYFGIAFTSDKNTSNPVLVSSDFRGEFRCKCASLGDDDRKIWNSRSSSYSCSATIAISADGKIIARRYDHQPPQLWNLQTGEELSLTNLDAEHYILALSSTGDMLATWKEKQITLWNIKNDTIISTFPLDIRFDIRLKNQIVFSSDDNIFACAGKEIRLWNLQTKCEMKTLKAFSHVNSLAFSPIEPILASGCYDGTIKLWDLETFEEIHSFIGHQQEIIDLKFSPNGKLLTSCDKNLIRLWKFNRSSS